MSITRRSFLAAGATGVAAHILPVKAAPRSGPGIDATQLDLHPGSPDDQSKALQSAIDKASNDRVPLWLAPGVYRTGNLNLPAGAQITGTNGATRIILTQGPSMFSAEHADKISFSGLILDGNGQALPKNRGLIHILSGKGLRIADCRIDAAGGNAIALDRCDGEISRSTITGAADNALFCNDSNGMRIIGNTITKSGNGGIRVWQSSKRQDGSLIAENHIDDTGARDGGSGQNGNAINVFRAAGVIVRGNFIRNAAFSAIRGNAASFIQIDGNTCSALGEVAIYSEFDFEHASITSNVIDGAGSGISVTNFKEGGHGAVVRNNTIRNVRGQPAAAGEAGGGIGIATEADATVIGNVIEHADNIAISAGWGPYLREVTVADNMIRDAGIGVAVSVADGAGKAVISGNQIENARRGAIIGMEWQMAVTGDLAVAGAARYPKLQISGNRVS